MSRHLASYSDDWLSKGEAIARPDQLYNREKYYNHLSHVVRTEKETVLLFYGYQQNDLWLTSWDGYTLKDASGKEYRETGHDGLPGFDHELFWSPDCGFYHAAVYFPALPDNVETVDVLDANDGSIVIRGLQVAKEQTARDDVLRLILYGEYLLRTLNFNRSMPDIVRTTMAELTQDETVVFMNMLIEEARSFKGYVDSDFTLTLPDGRELKPLRIEGVPVNKEFDRGGDHVNTYFQIVFPSTTLKDWTGGGHAVLKGTVCHEPVQLDIFAAVHTKKGAEKAQNTGSRTTKTIKTTETRTAEDGSTVTRTVETIVTSDGGGTPSDGAKTQQGEFFQSMKIISQIQERKIDMDSFSNIPAGMVELPPPTDSIALYVFGTDNHGMPVQPAGPILRLSENCKVVMSLDGAATFEKLPGDSDFFPGTSYMLNNCGAPWARWFFQNTGILIDDITDEEKQQRLVKWSENKAIIDSLRFRYETLLSDAPTLAQSRADLICLVKIPYVEKIKLMNELDVKLVNSRPIDEVLGMHVTECCCVSMYSRKWSTAIDFILFIDNTRTNLNACLQQLFRYVRFQSN